jgi:hypothetical protein
MSAHQQAAALPSSSDAESSERVLRRSPAMDLVDFCAENGRDFEAARRMVLQLQNGVERHEACAIVLQLLKKGESMGTSTSNGSTRALTVEDSLKGIEARRVALDAEIEQLEARLRDLKRENKDLGKAATALRRITGDENRDYYCDRCELPLTSKMAKTRHDNKFHGGKQKKTARRRTSSRR